MKTLINNRPLFLIFLGLTFGIITSGLFLCNKITEAIVILTLCLTIILILLIIAIKHKPLLRNTFIITLTFILGACLLLGSFGYKLNNFASDKIEGAVIGRINDFEVDDNSMIIELSNVKINDSNLNGKIKLYVFEYTNIKEDINIGDYITFDGTLRANDIIVNKSFNTSVVNNDYYYSGYIDVTTLKITDGSTTIFEDIKIKTENLINQNMTEDTASISIALIFGDKSGIDDGLYAEFSYSGIAHILSVSGLHVGFIVALILFVLNKLNVKNKPKFFITLTILLLYCMICGFSASVVRASIMSLCVMLALVIGKRQDILSSISLAGIILLLINPFNLYNIGFQLSFASVFGIIFLAKPLTNLLYKIKLPKFLAESFAITICATIFTYPIVANVFGFISLISLITNLVILPIFSVYFSLLFIVFLITLILPFGFLYVPLSYFFTFIIILTKFFSKFPIINIAPMDIFSALSYYLTLFALSKFLMLSNKAKTSVACCLFVIFSTVNAINQTPIIFNNHNLLAFNNVADCFIITTTDNKKILIGIGDGEEYTTKILKQQIINSHINKIDQIVMPHYDDKYQNAVCDIAKHFNTTKVIIPDYVENSTLLGLSNSIYNNSIITLADCSNLNLTANINLITLNYNGTIKGFLINYLLDDTSAEFLIIKGTLTINQANGLKPYLNESLKLIVCENQTAGVDLITFTNTKIIDKTLMQNNLCYAL